MRQIYKNLGTRGVVYDVHPYELGPEFWSNARNVRFQDFKVVGMPGSEELNPQAAIEPIWVDYAPGPITKQWVYGDLDNIYVFDGLGHTKITRASSLYNTNETNSYDLEMFGGLPIINNYVDLPQLWSPPAKTQLLVDLPNWPATWRAKIFRSFKSFLIALNLNKDGTLLPHNIAWSAPAEPGSIPTTWDASDPTNLAGEVSFSDTGSGGIVNGKILGELFLIYKESSIWALQFVGGNEVFGRVQLRDGIGLRAPKTLISVPGRDPRHFFMSLDNFYLYDGREAIPVFDKRFRSTVFRLINPNRYQQCFSVLNTVASEIWFCFPEVGASWATSAVVWNYIDNTYTIRDMGNVAFAKMGLNTELAPVIKKLASGVPFDDETFFSDGTGFAQLLLGDTNQILFEAVPGTGGNLYTAESNSTFYGQAVDRFVERKGIAYRIDNRGNYLTDYTSRKTVHRIWVHGMEDDLDVQIGVQETQKDEITWTSKLRVLANQEYFDLPIPVSGRFISVRFYGIAGKVLGFTGYNLDVSFNGENQ